jgi:hypothetical protein
MRSSSTSDHIPHVKPRAIAGERVAERAVERVAEHAASTAGFKAAERAVEAVGERVLERTLERAGAVGFALHHVAQGSIRKGLAQGIGPSPFNQSVATI